MLGHVTMGTQGHQVRELIIAQLASFDLMVNLQVFE